MEPGSSLGTQGLELLIFLLLLTCCMTLGKSINPSGPFFCMSKLLISNPLPGTLVE